MSARIHTDKFMQLKCFLGFFLFFPCTLCKDSKNMSPMFLTSVQGNIPATIYGATTLVAQITSGQFHQLIAKKKFYLAQDRGEEGFYSAM
jgi:hypothetical protein